MHGKLQYMNGKLQRIINYGIKLIFYMIENI